ncbi:MAG: FAD-dependent oxidoreductase [Gammaproteobacteria bacterium]|nr:FAD-dependent oxidoreductase [Gammaproteobacteria bacterium]
MTAISERLGFQDLQTHSGLEALDKDFLQELRQADPDLHQRLTAYRGGATLKSIEVSTLLIGAAPHLQNFLAHRFDIQDELSRQRAAVAELHPIMVFKDEFVKKRAKRYKKDIRRSFSELNYWLDSQLGPRSDGDRELAVAQFAVKLLQDEGNTEALDRLTEWCIRAGDDVEGRAMVSGWTSFHLPRAVDHARLVPLARRGEGDHSYLESPAGWFRQRDGFALTDNRMSLREVVDEINYCVYCHKNEGDFCSIGFPKKKKQPELGLKVDPLDVTLTGCPLEEKISEMHTLKKDGHAIAALAVAMVDNPMVPATGHRICNDCMKGCIYQKQDPVNIPQIETRVLTDVLDLPWGVEVYDLLTRWNPLRREQYIVSPANGKRVLIAGMGPAGFTMAHHLTMAGCTVVGIDGLKIEPLPQELLNEPVRDYASLCEHLDERIMAGFGGVAEYGITVRWDKNFLKLIYLTLARRAGFQVFGGVRFGGTITLEDAWNLGFDHVCVANGAGYPRVINIGNSLARGMRQANDFLMALQLTGAAKEDSLANLQVRLPAVVIGGGLTAIDTATEVQAYYVKQVEKVLHRHESLQAAYGRDHIEKRLDAESRAILAEFLEHGRSVRAERDAAARENRQPDFTSLLRGWGGVSIIYRKSINESPAYQRNHEEIIKAMEEGIYYVEGMEPIRADLDEYDHVDALICHPRVKKEGRWIATGKEVRFPARSILVAAGTFPNTIYENEHPGTFRIEDNHFATHVEHSHTLQPVAVAEHSKSPEFGPFTSYVQDHRNVSLLGDAHPVFNGSVVKAIASSARSYPEVLKSLDDAPARDIDTRGFQERVHYNLDARVDSIDTSHPAVIEIRVRAPLAAKNFEPGQFFRLQMLETASDRVLGTRLQIPLQTVSGAGIDGDMVRLFLLPWGANARLIQRLKPGDPLVLMGPTGAPTPIHEDRTVMVVAGTWGAAAMLGLGRRMRERNNRVLYIGAFGDPGQVYCQDELERVADQIIWATASEALIEARRPGDCSVRATDIIDLILRYDGGELAARPGIALADIDEILVMGSSGLLKGMQAAMTDRLAGVFKPDIDIKGTVGSPMQCMLKGVCAQCLQWQIDPETGCRTKAVFSCAVQDQPLMWIDVDNLVARQSQNRVQEHITNLWVDHVLSRPEAAQ